MARRLPGNTHDPDSFDLAILGILQTDNHVSHREIGEQVCLSAPAVQRRISRMEAAGIIEANVALCSPDALGRPLTIVALVQMVGEKQEEIDRAKLEFQRAPEIQQCYYVTGEADFVLVMSLRDMKEYEALTQRLFFGDPNVKRFQTLVAMDRVKTNGPIPV
jgi:DNA-binding Lrp family transcriptional regulator